MIYSSLDYSENYPPDDRQDSSVFEAIGQLKRRVLSRRPPWWWGVWTPHDSFCPRMATALMLHRGSELGWTVQSPHLIASFGWISASSKRSSSSILLQHEAFDACCTWLFCTLQSSHSQRWPLRTTSQRQLNEWELSHRGRLNCLAQRYPQFPSSTWRKFEIFVVKLHAACCSHCRESFLSQSEGLSPHQSL